MSKHSILKNTLKVGKLTLISRAFGFIREMLMARYLGADVMSDAFQMAFTIPNSFRKIFAEGALSAAFVPAIVRTVKSDGKKDASSLMSLAFLFFEGLVLVLCALCVWKADAVMSFVAPGFSAGQHQYAVTFLRILMPFIFFISSSALLAGALQAVNSFFVPAFSPVLLNIVFIAGLIVCWFGALPVVVLCYFILFGGFLQLILHIATYLRLGFSFGAVNRQACKVFAKLLVGFFVCCLSMSVFELNFFIDKRFGSFLPVGSVSLLSYAFRFVGIPLGVFAVSFATVLLPHISRLVVSNPKRLGFYLLEAAKAVLWVTLPATIVLCFFSTDIFRTLFLSKKFSLAQASEAGAILSAYSVGLFFFSLNKILLNIYYATQSMLIPTVVTVIATFANYGLNSLLVGSFSSVGIAMATAISSALQVILLSVLLRKYFEFKLYIGPLFKFMCRYILQLVAVFIPFFVVFRLFSFIVQVVAPTGIANFLLNRYGFWFWAGPMILGVYVALFIFRRLFKIRLYFVD